MTHVVLSQVVASISELKKNPMGTVAAGGGSSVAILNRNEPAFYCVPAKEYEAMMDRLEDHGVDCPLQRTRKRSDDQGFA